MSAAADLKAWQEAFLRAVLDENAPLPEGWGNCQTAGMSIYRGNYRLALLGAIKETFERTAQYVGARAFGQASAHHAIAHPPSGWSIDEAGTAFDTTCRELFANNPEVADLAWLEWTMMKLAGALDTQALTPEAFAQATSAFGDDEWMELRLDLQPLSEARVVETDLAELWKYLNDESGESRPAPRLDHPRGCLVSREGERPTFHMIDAANASAYNAAAYGASYGEIIVMLAGVQPAPDQMQAAATKAGQMLGGWLNDGLIIGLQT